MGSGSPFPFSGKAARDDVVDSLSGAGAIRRRPFPGFFAVLPDGRRSLRPRSIRSGRFQQPLRRHRRDCRPDRAPRRLRALDASLRARSPEHVRSERPGRTGRARRVSRHRRVPPAVGGRRGGAPSRAHRQQHVHAPADSQLLPPRRSSHRAPRRNQPFRARSGENPFGSLGAVSRGFRPPCRTDSVDLALRAFEERTDRRFDRRW